MWLFNRKTKPENKRKVKLIKKYTYRLRITLSGHPDGAMDYTHSCRSINKMKPLTPFIKFIKWYYKRPQSTTYRFYANGRDNNTMQMIQRIHIVNYYAERTQKTEEVKNE